VHQHSTALVNLRDEGITDGVDLVGDVMYDALLAAVAGAENESAVLDRLD